ncbi:nuclear receptor-interacting protein 2 isoform X1 [Polyodon spathula]|uniref:nuclear receptor-interacting protein 2 isoform X1 n=1 Tax=Polyodon spathula TaxID=7913 RepID=UPI001B7F73AD|nr:nuclear receptor-interacting protein 2 isoform X1 [Polyodon spathula]
MTDSKKSEMQIRDKAILHQQRRLKQATQFTHKDSAGLLPLDGLKQLGTSKDLQPHSIVQRRLLEGNITRLRGEGRDFGSQVRSPLVEEKGDQKEEIYKPRKSLIVHCTCCDKEVKATINTGYHQNIVSQSCFRQLGLTDMQEVSSDEESGHSFPFGSTLMGRVEKLELLVGQEKVECSALVVGKENTPSSEKSMIGVTKQDLKRGPASKGVKTKTLPLFNITTMSLIIVRWSSLPLYIVK